MIGRWPVFLLLALTSADGFAGCPDPAALDAFRYQIAYERQQEEFHLMGWSLIHADVWMRGTITGFYIREEMKDAAPGLRMSYLFDVKGLRGEGTCPVAKDWQNCIEDFAVRAGAEDVGPTTTCATTLSIPSIPPWRPSPDSPIKREIARELRQEIEQKWRGVLEIVIRDFNLRDNQITMFLRMPDGIYYQGCAFQATLEPHCEGWHLFGQVPTSSLRKWVFDKPYRLK